MANWMQMFSTPTNEYRPKARYWMPHSLVSEQGLRRDVADLAARGFGGIEVVAMNSGFPPQMLTADTMWGSSRWCQMMQPLLHEAREQGLSVDMANGPGWPIVNVTATDPDDETALYELAYGLRVLQAGEVYEGEAPLPTEPVKGTRRLLCVSLYRITEEQKLDASSYRALPTDGHVAIEAPNEGKWALFAFWEQPSSQRNGKFIVIDHFSQKATDAVMDFWEDKILPALGEEGGALQDIFCDSLEYHTQMDWSRGFVAAFCKRKGYDILPYLPCLGNPATAEVPDRNRGVFPPSNISGYEFSDADLQHRVNFDYLEMLTHLYQVNHLDCMRRRANALGLRVRYQVAYNRNLEAESSALYPDVPENEGLGRPLLDNYRNMAAAVNLARKPIYSFECAAEMNNAYAQTHEDLLWWAKRSYLGGMNAQVIHGASYCGYYEGEGAENGLLPHVNWPGYEGFGKRSWSNAWNRTLAPAHQRAALTYLARCNFVLRNPHKVDVAIYQNRYSNKSFAGAFDGGYIFRDRNVLGDAGYTYEFLSAALMEHPNARVEKGIFDAEGAAYRAIVIDNEEYMPLSVARHLAVYAQAGLSVIFVGCLPRARFYESEGEDDHTLQEILGGIPYTLVPDATELPAALRAAGVLPRAMPDASSSLRSLCVEVAGAPFYYLYNTNAITYPGGHAKLFFEHEKASKAQRVRLSLLGEGEVYAFDAYNGTCTLLGGEKKNGRTEIELSFAADEAKILAVLTDVQACALGLAAERVPALALRAEIPLRDWTLTLRRALPPQEGHGTFYETQMQQQEPLSLSTLLPWCEIKEEWGKLAGVGTYTTTFQWDRQKGRVVFFADKVTDTYAVTLNGVLLPAADPARGETDLTPALSVGENRLTVEVASPLRNAVADAVRSEQPDLYGMWGDPCLRIYQ